MLPTRKLPERPDLDQLRKEAKELLEAFAAGEIDAIAEVSTYYRDSSAASFVLNDAQFVLARSYGFDSWPKLKAFVDGATARQLSASVRANDLERVRAILKSRPELINAANAWNDEHTALHYAVLGRMPEMVRLLMEHGAGARAGVYPHTDATSALMIATDRGYDDIATIIREEEKRRETVGRAAVGDFPAELWDAIRAGDDERAIAIVRANPGLVHLHHPGNGWTLLHAASARLLKRLAAWLLDHGAGANQRAQDGSTPLDVAGRRSDARERKEKLASLVDLLRKKDAELTVRSAVILGDVDFLRARHAEGSLTTPLDPDGWLLGLAVDFDRPDILELLLDFGLDPDARVRVNDVDETAFTWGMPLYQCARYGKHTMAEMLLERGADPNGQVYASGTPLSEAYGQRDERMIALLERYGGQSNPSMAGLYRRKDLALKLLAEHGDAKLPDDGFSSGTVAEQLIGAAARGGDPEILRMAMDRVDYPDGDPRWNGLLTAPLGFWNHWIGPWCHLEWDRSTYLTCFKMLLERCGPPNGRLRFGTTVLHAVVTMGDHVMPEERVAFATALLDAGARTDLRDDLLKSTPMGWACRWGREELVRLFLDRGGDPVEADAEPWATPVAWAEKKGHGGVLAMLRNEQGR
jgi:ankyrin repeat protein